MRSVPVIIAGGAGTRLWPLSRDKKPKQFQNLSGRGSLLSETITRLLPLKPEKLIAVTSIKYEEMTLHEIEACGIPGVILCEPMPRNTAAAILYAAIYLQKEEGDPVMVVLPADHHIGNMDEFARILGIAIQEAHKGRLVTIGIKPSYPETGYGYIQSSQKSGTVLDVEKFVEKPDIDRAKKYLESGDYFWNSGIFAWKTSVIMASFKKLMPKQVAAFAPLAELDRRSLESNKGEIWKLKEKVFSELESVSIDFGILEKTGNRAVIPADFGWADLGSWKSIDDILAPDGNGNRSPQPDKALFLNAENCTVFSENKRITVVGLSDIVVVEAEDEILVIHKDASQDVKKVVEMIKKS